MINSKSASLGPLLDLQNSFVMQQNIITDVISKEQRSWRHLRILPTVKP